MPVITALEVHHKNNERVRLYLDDAFAMELPLLDAASLHSGQCLTIAEVEALAEAGTVQRAFDRAVNYLSYRPRSTDEIRRYLANKAVPESLIAIVVERLQRLKYLDDLDFAKFWLENRERFKPMAPRALRYELRKKGVEDGIIDTLLSEYDTDDAAYRAAVGRIQRYKGITRQEFRQKLSGILRRRGFGAETIRDVVLRLQRELDESEAAYFRLDAAE